MAAEVSSPQLASSSSSDFAIFQSTLCQFEQSQKELDSKLQQGLQKLDLNFRSLDDLVKTHKTQIEQYKHLSSMLSQLESEGSLSEEQKESVPLFKLKLAAMKKSLEKMNETKPATGSHFLRFMMGKVNSKMWKKGELLQFRDEYNKFKHRTTFIFIIFPLLQLFVLPDSETLWKLHQVWLVYYYISLSLRENILQANGSSIHNWWIIHHYIAAIISCLSLLYPQDRSIWGKEFAFFVASQGFVMLLQNRYQSKRQYVRKSLGKAKEVDVETSETIVEKPTDLKILIPLLFSLYAFEVFFGIKLYILHPSWEVLAVGVMFVILGIGNAITTGQVLFQKNSLRRQEQTKRVLRSTPSLAAISSKDGSGHSTGSSQQLLPPSSRFTCDNVVTPPAIDLKRNVSSASTDMDLSTNEHADLSALNKVGLSRDLSPTMVPSSGEAAPEPLNLSRDNSAVSAASSSPQIHPLSAVAEAAAEVEHEGDSQLRRRRGTAENEQRDSQPA